MPPAIPRRSLRSSLPTLLSLSKLFHLIPQAATSSSRHKLTGGADWAVNAAANAPIEPEDPPDSPIFWWKLGLSICLVLAGGVFAGLTLALMGSDDLNLRVLSTSSDDPKERKAAAKVLRLLARGRHWVLVVLLLGNVSPQIVNESLPIFLDDVLGGGVAAVIVSTTMIVIFGEIIPQAVCVRYGLSIGGVCAPLVLTLMIVFAPIAWPIAKLLDYVLGRDEGHTYKKAELKSFLQFHRTGDEPLRDDEIGILNGVLSLNDKEAKEIMTPIGECLTLSSDKVLDHEAIDHILLSGFSRIPIHESGQKDNFIGMLLVKRLITYNPEEEWPVSKFPLLPLPEALPNINCFQALDYFQTGRAHLLLISETPGRQGGALGIVSLEDLIEEIIGEEIVDETDRYQDNRSHKIAKRSGPAAVMRGIIERQRVVNAFSRIPSRNDTSTPQQHPVQLRSPSGTNDALLVKMDNGSLVAEPVSVPEGFEHTLPTDGRKLVVGANGESMDRIMSEGADVRAIIPTSMGQDRDVMEAEIVLDSEGQENAGGKTNGDTPPDLLGNEDELTISEVAFDSQEEFQRAAKAFLDKYDDVKGHMDMGPSRTNVGWEWKEGKHKWAPTQGYLYRRCARYVQPSDRTDTDEYDDSMELKEEDQEHEERGGERSLTCAQARYEKVEVEHHIVYSKTFHVPQLLLRAWDSTGTPLSLTSLISLSLLHPSSHLPQSPHPRSDAIMLDPHSPFPLLQQTEHPVIGDVVWSVHPCQIAAAVNEVLDAEGSLEPQIGKSAGKQEQSSKERGLKWLETWIMISSGVINLSNT